MERDVVWGDILKRGALARGWRGMLLVGQERLEGGASGGVRPGRAPRRVEGK